MGRLADFCINRETFASIPTFSAKPVSFADWDFARSEGQPTTLNKFQADGTYNALAAMRRLLRGGETPRRTSAFFETPEGTVVFCEATDWPKEMPKR